MVNRKHPSSNGTHEQTSLYVQLQYRKKSTARRIKNGRRVGIKFQSLSLTEILTAEVVCDRARIDLPRTSLST